MLHRFSHRRHKVPELNTTSTADISFMLLIFFLVTTSMDVDKGLSRMLPPKENTKKQEQTDVNKNNLMTLQITADNKFLVDDKPTDISKLRNKIISFVKSRGKKHLISIKTDANANYETYFKIQNELAAAYNILRNSYALKLFGHKYELCSQEQKDAVKEKCPQRIAENYDLQEKGGSQ